MNPLGQIGLLVWKNFLIQRRQPLWTLFQLLLPVCFSLLLLILRITLVTTATHDVTKFEPFEPGFLPLFLTNSSLADRFFPSKLAYTPDTPVTRLVMETVTSDLNRLIQQYSNISIEEILDRLNITESPCQNFTLKFSATSKEIDLNVL